MNITDIILPTLQDSLWRDVGIVSKIETLYLSASLLIWGAGMAEGAIKTTFKAAKFTIKSLAGRATADDRTILKSQWSITKGCSALTAIAMIPLGLKLIPFN